MVAALALSIFWGALTMRLLGIGRSVMRAVLILATIALILFGSSVATSWYQEATAARSYQPKAGVSAPPADRSP